MRQARATRYIDIDIVIRDGALNVAVISGQCETRAISRRRVSSGIR